MKKKHLVIGYGEIGKALYKVLEKNAIVRKYDFKNLLYLEVDDPLDFIHICFPYTNKFIQSVMDYKVVLKNAIIVVHSTVPIGTCEKLGVAHSAVIGRHPYLYKSLLTFTKYISGENAKSIQKEFKKAGMKTKIIKRTRDTESAKLWSTTYYGMLILINKEIKKWCDANNVDFNFVNKEWNKNYNKGYKELGYDFIKPILKYMPGPIGGHCILPNAEFLDTWLSEEILKRGKK